MRWNFMKIEHSHSYVNDEEKGRSLFWPLSDDGTQKAVQALLKNLEEGKHFDDVLNALGHNSYSFFGGHKMIQNTKE